ncbi:MAG: RNA-guided pseudouridylation complex pseudouridine synthase subunit Cbf5 [Candidatus Pacearchaeota archaeon]|jgi:H/ACA ribonucleoprotein complex subunit 4
MEIDLTKIQKEKPINELLQFSIINIDKPSGQTSFEIDIIIKEALNLTKSSHFGTLDPQVSGVLPIAINRACRLMPYFIGSKKEYVGIMRIHNDLSIKEIEKQMKEFIGEIIQKPPLKSNVKREERLRNIYSFELIEKDEKEILFKTEVQAGTYIRKLIDDLGQKIGGAHMLELRRTRASIFEEQDSITLFDFYKAVEEYKKGNEKLLREILIPGEIISKALPVVYVNKESITRLYRGSPLFKKDVINFKEKWVGEKIAVFNEQKFIGVFSVIKHASVFAQPEFTLQPIN